MSSAAPVVETAHHETSRRAGAAFSDILRERTKAVHREAERSGFIADLIRGRATREGYASYLHNLVPVYAALESALDRVDPSPLLGPFADPRLRRLQSLLADLDALSCAHGSPRLVFPETSAYTAAIDEAAAEPDRRLVAHAYARYLGDLSGGQILRPLLARSLGLGPDMLALYDFPAIPDLDTPKLAMRRALDDLDPASPGAEAIVEEAIEAFRHTIAMSTAVAAALI